MLDLHKLKLKYRDMGGDYNEQLMKPLFKTKDRNYTYLKTDPEHDVVVSSKQRILEEPSDKTVEKIINSADHDFSTVQQNTSPHHELLGETANDKFKSNGAGSDHLNDIQNQQRTTQVSMKNETFHSAKLNAQYKKDDLTPEKQVTEKLEVSTPGKSSIATPSQLGGQQQVSPLGSIVSPRLINKKHAQKLGGLYAAVSPIDSSNAISVTNLMQNIESFGLIQPPGQKRNFQTSGFMTQDNPSIRLQNDYKQAESSRHFDLKVKPQRSHLAAIQENVFGSQQHHPRFGRSNGAPQQKEKFFRSGKGQGLHKIIGNSHMEGDIVDFNNAAIQPHIYMEQINQKQKPIDQMLEFRRRQSQDPQLQLNQGRNIGLNNQGALEANADNIIDKSNFGKSLRHMQNMVAKSTIQTTQANQPPHIRLHLADQKMDYSFQSATNNIAVHGSSLPQSGLRHAVALEKLINSHNSDDSVLKELRAMRRDASNQNSDTNPEEVKQRKDLQYTLAKINAQIKSPVTPLSPRINAAAGQQSLVTQRDQNESTFKKQRRGRSVSVMNSDLPGDPVIRQQEKFFGKGAKNNQNPQLTLTKNPGAIGFSSKVLNLKPIITTKPRGGPLAELKRDLTPTVFKKRAASMMNQYNDSNIKKIMKQTSVDHIAQAKAIQFFGSGADIKLQSNYQRIHLQKGNSPSMAHFPSHMNQTLSSVRRQSISAFQKNEAIISQEDQVKAHMKRIKNRRKQIQQKFKDNHELKVKLQFEMQKNGQLQNEQLNSPQQIEESPLRSKSVLLQNTHSEQFTVMNIDQVAAVDNLNATPGKTTTFSLFNVGQQSIQQQNNTTGNNSQVNFATMGQEKIFNQKGSPVFFSPQATQNLSTVKQKQKEHNRIHMLYKGKFQDDVEKERKLAVFQLQKVKFEVDKQANGVQDLKQVNSELRVKIQRYELLIADQKKKVKAIQDEITKDDLDEISVTRKLGHTDMGDMSDNEFEVGSAFNRTLNNRSNNEKQMFSKVKFEEQSTANRDGREIQQEDYEGIHQILGIAQKDNQTSISQTLEKYQLEEMQHVNGIVVQDVELQRQQTRHLNIQKQSKQRSQSPKSQTTVFNQTINSQDGLSKIAVQKTPMSANIDPNKLQMIMNKLQMYILKQEKCVDVIISFLDQITKANSFTKATFYAITPILKQTLRKGAMKDKAKYFNSITYKDSHSGESSNITGIASVGHLCEQPVFESLEKQQAPNLLPSNPEDLIIASIQDHKIGILVKNDQFEFDGGCSSSMLLQVEYNSHRAKNKPFNMADVNLLKLCMFLLFQRLQKFVIITQDGKSDKSPLPGIIKFCQRTIKYECHKDLGRNLQKELCQIAHCEECVTLFEDRGSNQLYTIAYTEDDDFRNTNQNSIDMVQARLNKLQNQQKKDVVKIELLEKQVLKMKDELEMDMSVRSLILNKNHMICLPSDQGLAGMAFSKAKTVYFNNFDKVTQSSFVPQMDNVKQVPGIKNFVFYPIIGHDNRPNGVIQLYSCDNSISRLSIKKVNAIRKFLGGCLDNVNLINKNLEMVVGSMGNVSQAMEACIQREKSADSDSRMLMELQSAVKVSLKEITFWHTRATTEPGFMPEPVVEDEKDAKLRRFLEQKEIDDAKELAREQQAHDDELQEESKGSQ